MNPNPASATHTPFQHTFDHVYHQESEKCCRQLEKLFAREALETYSQEKAGQLRNPEEIKRVFVMSNIHHTMEQMILNPAKLLQHVDAKLSDHIKSLKSHEKDFFNGLLSRTVEKFQRPENAALAHLLCECEFGPKKKIVNLKYDSSLLRSVVLDATLRFFNRPKL